MRIWLITVGEPLPIDEGTVRLYRTGILADLLAAQGHDVIWWTSTFDHFHKRNRYFQDTVIHVNDKLRIHLMYALGYRRNISVRRMLDHHLLGRAFSRLAPAETKPDIILCSLPTLELAKAAVEYGKRQRIPVVLDIRDMWPDIFVRHVPCCARAVANFAILPMRRTTRAACSGAFAICGHAPGFIDWGLAYANRERTSYDRHFPFGYTSEEPLADEMRKAAEFWRGHGISGETSEFIICFFGTVGHQFDLDTVIRAACMVRSSRDVKFVICGVGDRLEGYRRMSQGCDNIVFPGWVNSPQIRALMRLSKLGLAPYVCTSDFEASIPNKIIEYLSGGLPVLTSLQCGIVPELLERHDCGLQYNGTPEGLAHLIGTLIDSPERLSTMSRCAAQLFQEQFTASKVYSEMVAYLREIVSAYNHVDADTFRGTASVGQSGEIGQRP